MTALVKVLLVDDEREFVCILTQRLTKRNCSVIFAHNGKDALAQLEEVNDIEVAILDIKMPGRDGIETLKRIKEKWPLFQAGVAAVVGHVAPQILPVPVTDAKQAPTLEVVDSVMQPRGLAPQHRQQVFAINEPILRERHTRR